MKAIINSDPCCQWLIGRAQAYSFVSLYHSTGKDRAFFRFLMRSAAKRAIERARFCNTLKGVA